MMKSRKTGWGKLAKKSLLSFFLKGRKGVRGRQSNSSSSSCCFSWLRCSSETVVTPSPSRVDSHAAAELQEYRVNHEWGPFFFKILQVLYLNCPKKRINDLVDLVAIFEWNSFRNQIALLHKKQYHETNELVLHCHSRYDLFNWYIVMCQQNLLMSENSYIVFKQAAHLVRRFHLRRLLLSHPVCDRKVRRCHWAFLVGEALLRQFVRPSVRHRCSTSLNRCVSQCNLQMYSSGKRITCREL